MTATIRYAGVTALILINCFAVTSQKLLIIDYCLFDEDNVMSYDTVDIYVHLFVDDTSWVNDNTFYGDVYYWFQSDSMVLTGTPPRLINTNLNPKMIFNGGVIDTVKLDIRPEEIRLGPTAQNYFCVWPAAQSLEISDTAGCGTMNCNPQSLVINESGTNSAFSVYPNPTDNIIHLNYQYLVKVEQIKILTLEGKVVFLMDKEEYSDGRVSLEQFRPGCYILECVMNDKTIRRFKIMKR